MKFYPLALLSRASQVITDVEVEVQRQAEVQSGYAKWMCKLDMQSGCAKWICKEDMKSRYEM